MLELSTQVLDEEIVADDDDTVEEVALELVTDATLVELDRIAELEELATLYELGTTTELEELEMVELLRVAELTELGAV